MPHVRSDRIDLHSENDALGEIRLVRIRFGPHYGVEVSRNEEGVSFRLVATHHGFEVDASEVDGQLERVIQEVRNEHPDTVVD
jgi:hypothetical protein